MFDYGFRSSLAGYLQTFVVQKKAAGYQYKSNIGKLRMFDAMVLDRYSDATTVTRDIFNCWIDIRTIYPRTILNDVNIIRQFSKYLNGIGIDAYIIPDGSFKIPSRYEPHIYTDKEKISFFHAVDQCPWIRYSPTKSYVAPMVFRMIYCCGLRSSEVRNLRKEDIDLNTGRVTIRASKCWKERVIYTSRDLLDNLREYDTQIIRLLPQRAAFFPNRKGTVFSSSVFDEWFHEFWDSLPEASFVIGNKPRLNDWRHTFFTDRLNAWIREDVDVNALNMYLSEYGGHSNYAADDYYQHLTTSFYSEMEKRMASLNKEILPEVHHEA